MSKDTRLILWPRFLIRLLVAMEAVTCWILQLRQLSLRLSPHDRVLDTCWFSSWYLTVNHTLLSYVIVCRTPWYGRAFASLTVWHMTDDSSPSEVSPSSVCGRTQSLIPNADVLCKLGQWWSVIREDFCGVHSSGHISHVWLIRKKWKWYASIGAISYSQLCYINLNIYSKLCHRAYMKYLQIGF